MTEKGDDWKKVEEAKIFTISVMKWSEIFVVVMMQFGVHCHIFRSIILGGPEDPAAADLGRNRSQYTALLTHDVLFSNFEPATWQMALDHDGRLDPASHGSAKNPLCS